MSRPMSIEKAMSALKVTTEYGLAKALGTSPQTVRYWRISKNAIVPPLWADRIKLIQLARNS